LFHGLEGTNQGIHQRQPGTVLSTGFSRHSGEVLSFDDRMSFFPGAPAVKPYPDPSGRLKSTAPVFITKGERNALMGFYPDAIPHSLLASQIVPTAAS